MKLPLVGREIPIVADDYSDPEKGTGAVKITPAHDFNDFEVGKRQGLDKINIMDAFGALNDAVPEAYRGLDRFAARKKRCLRYRSAGPARKDRANNAKVPHGDRSGVPIEPWLTDQWYVNAEEMAKPAIKAIEDGSTQFVPKNWEKTYFEWMNNIQPWCISRQLWWGHQIPAWYGPDRRRVRLPARACRGVAPDEERALQCTREDAERLGFDKAQDFTCAKNVPTK